MSLGIPAKGLARTPGGEHLHPRNLSSSHFDGDVLNHDIDDYLKHPNVVQGVWRRLAGPRPVRAPQVTAAAQVPAAERAANRKALLVGINGYPRPGDRLKGCVNDAFRLSATLQECGFDPYGVRFVMFLDCCHSGGLTRAGGPKVRMINPPDDIRHRVLRWDAERQMWVRRDLPELISVSRKPGWNVEDYIGSGRSTRRFGRAVRLRQHDDRTFDRLRKEYDHSGPYLPMIMQVCQEHQVAFEYHDGAAAYGAFTCDDEAAP